MENGAVRESRRILRRIQDHLYQAHANLDAQLETVDLVNVLHHPTSTLASLNYATPRRNTAWVSSEMIERGLNRLRELNRVPRVQYIEALYPPLFARSLRDLGLVPEWELPLMVYPRDGFNGTPAPQISTSNLPGNVTVKVVNDQQGIELWWYVWRNAFYDVLTLGVEPLFVGRDMAALKLGHQVDILLYRSGFPVGVTRLSIQDDTAHILALALMKEARTPELSRILYSAATEAALARDCALIYAPGEDEITRRVCRQLGFLDFGSIVCYTTESNLPREERDDRIMGQPVLALR